MTRIDLWHSGSVAVAIGALLISSQLVAGDPKTTHEPKMAALHIQNPDDLKWSPAPPSLPRGAEAAGLDGDMTKKAEFTVRLRFPANYKIAPHFHPADEHVTVIDGSLYMGVGDTLDEGAAKEVKTGGFHAIRKGVHHYAFTKGPAIIQLHGTGPWGITYLNPSDDPRKTAQK